MHPFYWESAHGNFGDDLNLWLWDFLLPGFRVVHPETFLVGVGTVLNEALLPSGMKKLVVGSGFGYGAAPDLSDKSEWDVRCVRGPLTAGKLGLADSFGIIDPAVMVVEMPEFRNLPRTGGVVFVPHWESTMGGVWDQVCRAAGIGYVDPCGEARSVIRAIAQAELVIAESMHAAILADAFRVPWIAVTTSSTINSFKWRDWAASLGVEYTPTQIPVSSRAEANAKSARFWGMNFQQPALAADQSEATEPHDNLVAERIGPSKSRLRSAAKQVLALPATLALRQARRATPRLSADTVLADRKDRLREVLAEIRRDYF